MQREAQSIVAERRGPEISALRTEDGRDGFFAWAGGQPKAGQLAMLAYNKACGAIRCCSRSSLHSADLLTSHPSSEAWSGHQNLCIGLGRPCPSQETLCIRDSRRFANAVPRLLFRMEAHACFSFQIAGGPVQACPGCGPAHQPRCLGGHREAGHPHEAAVREGGMLTHTSIIRTGRLLPRVHTASLHRSSRRLLAKPYTADWGCCGDAGREVWAEERGV